MIDGIRTRDLLGLADGSLPDRRRRKVAARVAASPRATAAVAAQRRALEATRAFAHARAVR